MNERTQESVRDSGLHECVRCPRTSWTNIPKSLPSVRVVQSIDLDVTESCNLACIYCFKWQKKAVHMDEETAKGAIDWLLDACGDYNGELKVNLMGGEPLLRFDLIRSIVPYGKMRARQNGKRLHFGCTTNCTHLTDEMMEFWRRFGMGFHCSIDGVPEVQNHNRPFLGGTPSSAAVERNVPKILAYRPLVMARATISPHSVPALLASAVYLAALGFRSMTFKAAVNCNWSSGDLEILRKEYEKLGLFYIKSQISGKNLKIEEFSRGLATMHSFERTSRFPCGAGRGVMLIDPRGDIWPCHRFGPHQCAGQFRLGSLGQAFNDRLRAVFLAYNVLEDSKVNCKDCRAVLVCRSWCYAECVDSTGTFYDPGNEHCEINKILFDEIVRIHDYLRSRRPEILRRIVNEG